MTSRSKNKIYIRINADGNTEIMQLPFVVDILSKNSISIASICTDWVQSISGKKDEWVIVSPYAIGNHIILGRTTPKPQHSVGLLAN